MAERRMLWKSISLSKKVNILLKSLEAKILYTWTIPYLDREGLMDADSEILKATVVPLIPEITTKNIEKFISEIEKAGLWELFETQNGTYLRDPVFFERQTPNPKEKPSIILPKIKGLSPRYNPDTIQNESRNNLDTPNRIEKNRIELKRMSEKVYDNHPRKGAKSDALKSICFLLKKGIKVEDLLMAQDNYKIKIQSKGTKKDFIIQANNFFGKAQRWIEYINLELDKDAKALRDFEQFQRDLRKNE